MGDAPSTRVELRRALALNAVTKPANVLAPAGVAVATLLLGVPWLLPVAVVCWLALVALTFFDEDEATRVGERTRAARRAPVTRELPASPPVAPEIAARLRAARVARASIRAAVEASASPLNDVSAEVDALVLALDGHAARAQRIRAFLDEDTPAALRERVSRRLTQLLEEMDHVVTTLQAVHAEILVTDGLEQRSALASEVAALRDTVSAASAGLEAAFDETR